MGSTAIARGAVLAPVLSTSTLTLVLRSRASILAQTASAQYSLLDTQSTAMSSRERCGRDRVYLVVYTCNEWHTNS